MNYSFASNLGDIGLGSATCSGGPNATPAVPLFVLIDAGQLPHFDKSLRRGLPNVPSAPIFEDSFAKASIYLSPVLLELNATIDLCREQVLVLDAVCRHLPVMGLLRGPVTLRQLTAHLRSLLLMEADGSPYLWRFADSQVLSATCSVLQPVQHARVFQGLEAWWTVDHDGVLDNAVARRLPLDTAPVATPLCLDERQTNALLTACAVPLLAGQLRHLEMSFASSLNHADQMRFAADCLAAARAAAIDDDAELASFAAERWLDRHRGPAPRLDDAREVRFDAS